MQKKIRRMFFVLEIIVSELVLLNSLYLAYNASHRLSMCQQTVLRFCVSLKVNFFNAPTLKVFNKYCKRDAIQIATVFQPICHVVCLKVL